MIVRKFIVIAVTLLMFIGCKRDKDSATCEIREASHMTRVSGNIRPKDGASRGLGARYTGGGVFAGTSPSWSPDGKTIVFAAITKVSSDLFAIGSDGKGLTRLTDTPFWECAPVFDPEGRIVFVSDRDSPGGEYYVIDQDGGGLQRLAPGLSLDCELGMPSSCFKPSFSPTGQAFIFSAESSGRRSLYLCEDYGVMPRQITQTNAKDFFPVFTADGMSALCMRLSQGTSSVTPSLVQVRLADGSSKTHLDDGIWRVPVALTRDGRFVDLLVMSKQTTFGIWSYALADASLRRLTQPDAHIGDVVSGPADSLLLIGDFARPYAYDIYSVTHEGPLSQRQLTSIRGFFSALSCSPDGQWITYVAANNRGLGNIVIMPSGGGTGRILCANHFDVD